MNSHPPLRAQEPASLLVMPGWDDDGKEQYDALRAELECAGWKCRRADLPDAGWPAGRRNAATREDSLSQAFADYDALRHGLMSCSAILGFSYGGYIAALVASKRPVDLLILRCPALYPDDHWLTPKAELDKRKLDVYRRREHGPSRNKALESCAEFTGDVLLIASERDQVIPGEVIESYASAFGMARSLQRLVLRDADHQLTLQGWREVYHREAVAWLEKKRVELADRGHG